MLQMGKWRRKEATDGAELAFEPRPPGSSPRPSPAWPVPVPTEASFEDAGLSGGPPCAPGGLTLAIRGAEERQSGGHTMISKGTSPLREQSGSRRNSMVGSQEQRKRGLWLLGAAHLPPPVCASGTIPWSLLHTPNPSPQPKLDS